MLLPAALPAADGERSGKLKRMLEEWVRWNGSEGPGDCGSEGEVRRGQDPSSSRQPSSFIVGPTLWPYPKAGSVAFMLSLLARAFSRLLDWEAFEGLAELPALFASVTFPLELAVLACCCCWCCFLFVPVSRRVRGSVSRASWALGFVRELSECNICAQSVVGEDPTGKAKRMGG